MLKTYIIKSLGFYKKAISPYLISTCRFYPSCSEYAKNAVETYGIGKGLLLAVWRVLRCNPFSRGGYDPVIKQKEQG